MGHEDTNSPPEPLSTKHRTKAETELNSVTAVVIVEPACFVRIDAVRQGSIIGVAMRKQCEAMDACAHEKVKHLQDCELPMDRGARTTYHITHMLGRLHAIHSCSLVGSTYTLPQQLAVLLEMVDELCLLLVFYCIPNAFDLPLVAVSIGGLLSSLNVDADRFSCPIQPKLLRKLNRVFLCSAHHSTYFPASFSLDVILELIFSGFAVNARREAIGPAVSSMLEDQLGFDFPGLNGQGADLCGKANPTFIIGFHTNFKCNITSESEMRCSSTCGTNNRNPTNQENWGLTQCGGSAFFCFWKQGFGDSPQAARLEAHQCTAFREFGDRIFVSKWHSKAEDLLFSYMRLRTCQVFFFMDKGPLMYRNSRNSGRYKIVGYNSLSGLDGPHFTASTKTQYSPSQPMPRTQRTERGNRPWCTEHRRPL
ncbi:hypothetical protein B0H10DRAFT_1967221 [Mycena sp. CBHHK59/15]|nr:hypothetical protein B0H10DRAFT_1967221 [Mycena sp. CBHHK59/15]